MKGPKKSQKNSGQIGIAKKRRNLDIEEANELMSGNILICVDFNSLILIFN